MADRFGITTLKMMIQNSGLTVVVIQIRWKSVDMD
ncbi:hypothetical protein AHF37_09609 [Paragonimus kellicotti]|nr:hypothetical protein AHF37_09609 [Paragonimus kellicotti]